MTEPYLSLLTPRGPGGVALLSLCGPGARRLLEPLWRPRRARFWPAPGRAALGTLVDAQGEVVDEILLTCAEDERYQLGCHSGPAVLDRLESVLVAAGARLGPSPGPPGLDALQLEAWRALPAVRTELGTQHLLAQVGGALGRAVASAGASLQVEPLEGLLATVRLGRALLEPPRVALVGLPNAGKSSLLNALLGRDRVIVTPQPGTTRDAVVAQAEVVGVPIEWVDTAGQREDTDALEAAGVQRAREVGAAAACRLVVLDGASLTPAALELAQASAEPRVLVLNKADLPRDPSAQSHPLLRDALSVSALRGEGLAPLRAAIRERVAGAPVAVGAPLVFTARQEAWLLRCRSALERGDAGEASAALSNLVAGAAFG